MNFPILFFAIDVATATCMVLLAARLLLSRPHLATAQIMALIAFDCVCHVVAGRQDFRFWIPDAFHLDVAPAAMAVLNLFRNLTAGLFMILCHRLFADRPRFPRWLLGAFAVQMLLEIPAHWPGPLPVADALLRAAPGLLQTVFAGFALYWTIASWQADLIESRRRARMLTTLFVGVDLFASGVLTRLLVAPDSITQYHVHETLVVSYLALAVLVLFQLFGGGIDAYLDPVRARPAPPVTDDSDTAVARLIALFEDGHVYREAGLSLSGLAKRAGLPEYRLRKIIHEQLGYANFNAFLHAWRIREACSQLRDPALRRTPILTIALSVGYQSVNTFNRGFRDVLDMTPSAYRALADAPPPPVPGAPKTE